MGHGRGASKPSARMHHGRPWLGAIAMGAALLAPGLAGADWPMARHDVKRTGMAKGTGNMVKPATYWRRTLGGKLASNQLLAADVNGDGKIELVFLRAGR